FENLIYRELPTSSGRNTEKPHLRGWLDSLGFAAGPGQPGASGPHKPEMRALHVEQDVHLSLYFHRLAVKHIWPVFPLAHRIQSCLNQNWMPGKRLQVFDYSALADDGLQNHVPVDVRDLGHLRILRLDI